MNKSAWHEKNKERVREYMREYQRKRRAVDPEKHRTEQRLYYLKAIDARRANARAYYEKTKRGRTLEVKYGVPRGWYDATLATQGGKCAVCRSLTPGGRFQNFHVDHCHASGKVRGLLCNACNHLLGCARDNVQTLRAAARYLTKYSTVE